MKVSKVSELLEMSEGTVPEAFTGIIKSVFRPSSGKNGQGNDFHLQKLQVSDGQSIIEVVMDGRPEVSRQQEGAEIYCCASRGQRGLSGLKRKTNLYKGKTTEQIWVYDSADVSFNGSQQGNQNEQHQNGNGGQNRQPQQQQQRQQGNQQRQQGGYNGNDNQGSNQPQRQQNNPPQQQQQQRPPQQGHATQVSPLEQQVNTMRDFDKRLLKCNVALQRCFDSTIKMVNELDERYKESGGFSLTNEAIKECAVTLFISVTKNANPADDRFFPVESFQTTRAKIEEKQAAQNQN